MTIIGTTITKQQQAIRRQKLVSDSAEMLAFLMRRHPEVMEQLQPRTVEAMDLVLVFGDDSARKACCRFILDEAWDNLVRCGSGKAALSTNQVLDHQHYQWSELHHFCNHRRLAA